MVVHAITSFAVVRVIDLNLRSSHSCTSLVFLCAWVFVSPNHQASITWNLHSDFASAYDFRFTPQHINSPASTKLILSRTYNHHQNSLGRSEVRSRETRIALYFVHLSMGPTFSFHVPPTSDPFSMSVLECATGWAVPKGPALDGKGRVAWKTSQQILPARL